jgi:SAM-dependent methyltransferase
MANKFKNIQAGVLKAFQEEIPSIYYSDKSKKEFNHWKNVMEFHYHDLMKFPKNMFSGKNLIDLGSGTGENTVYFDNWGAKCTLVEMNPNAFKISKNIFKKYSKKFNQNKFINKSIYDFKTSKKYDIAHSRGVFAHTNDPERAFKKLASLVKPGGYLIYGDGNKSGNFQNMLQRLAIFNFADNWDDMVKVAEVLFKEDLDRSQKFANRTRRCIIFDKWVVPRLTNPSIKEVLTWFKKNKIKIYSSYPNIMPSVFGDSLHHRPMFDIEKFMQLTSFIESYWLIQNKMDKIEIPKVFKGIEKLAKHQDDMVDYIDDYNLEDIQKKSLNVLSKKVINYNKTLKSMNFEKYLKNRTSTFCKEVNGFLSVLDTKDLYKSKKYISKCRELFRGAQGIRHIDFIGYKK